MTVVSDVPDEVVRQFHSQNAKPVVLQAYRATTGWQGVEHALLTTNLCVSLFNDGFTRVRARWRLTKREVKLKPIVEKHLGSRRSTWKP